MIGVNGKSFGAVKTAVLRLIRKGGYAPEWTQLMVFKSDRTRLRNYCAAHGNISLVEGFHQLLDDAKVKMVKENTRTGVLSALVDSLRYKAKEFNKDRLSERVKSGEFDDFIKDYYNKNNQ